MKAKTTEKQAAKTTATKKTTQRRTTTTRKKVAVKKAPQRLAIVKNDSWLEPFEGAIQGRHDHVLYKINELTGGKGKLSEFADGHLYFGLHRGYQNDWKQQKTS